MLFSEKEGVEGLVHRAEFSAQAGIHRNPLTAQIGREMKGRFFGRNAVFMSVCCLLWSAQSVGATQVHTSPEGLYAHQMAHLFFGFSMGILIYWLRQRSLTRDPGWRFVQYAAFFFIIWNLDAIVVHYLDGRDYFFTLMNKGSWHDRIDLADGSSTLMLLYYLAKLDHLLCVPAIAFLYLGLRRLLKQVQKTPLTERNP